MSNFNNETLTINNFSEICRTCSAKTNLNQLYENIEIVSMLESCTQMHFTKNDELPDKICTNCILKLNEVFHFINTCKITDETYRKCLIDNLHKDDVKIEHPILEYNIKEEYEIHSTVEIKEEVTTDELDTEIYRKKQRLNDPTGIESTDKFLQETIRIGKEFGCNSLLMRYFTEKSGAEKISMHILMTTFASTNISRTYEQFIAFSCSEMTSDACQDASNKTISKTSELKLELRYGRLTPSKINSVSCCKTPDEYFIENIIGFYKSNETKRPKINEFYIEKEAEKQLNIKRHKCGLVLNAKYPEFVSNPDGVTKDAVIKIKYPVNVCDVGQYVSKDGTLTPDTKAEMHLHMAMSNVNVGYLCIADPNFAVNNNVTIIKVDYNERYFIDVLTRCKDFWRTFIFPVLLKTVSHI